MEGQESLYSVELHLKCMSVSIRTSKHRIYNCYSISSISMALVRKMLKCVLVLTKQYFRKLIKPVVKNLNLHRKKKNLCLPRNGQLWTLPIMVVEGLEELKEWRLVPLKKKIETANLECVILELLSHGNCAFQNFIIPSNFI